MTQTRNKPEHRPRRRGLAGLLLVVGLGLMAGFAALAIDASLMAYVHEQLRVGAQAAAVAGAAQLMDENVLYPDRLQSILASAPNDGESAASGSASPQCARQTAAQIARARRAAIQLAELNYAARRPIELQANSENHPRGDIVVGWVGRPSRPHQELQVSEACGQVNSMMVRARLSSRRGNPLALWVGQLLGTPTIDLDGSVRASVDQHVAGFRPWQQGSAPVMPIGVAITGPNSWLAQATATAVPNQNDQYTFDPITRRVTLGSDGIPEIVVSIPLGNIAALQNAIPLRIAGSGPALTSQPLLNLLRQIDGGLRRDDLVGQGGAIVVGDQQSVLPLADRRDGLLVSQAAAKTRGEILAWPLGMLSIDAAGHSRFEIQTFAAGVAVDGYLSPDHQSAIIVVQPALLQSPTAVVAENQPRNPWIGKVVINQ